MPPPTGRVDASPAASLPPIATPPAAGPTPIPPRAHRRSVPPIDYHILPAARTLAARIHGVASMWPFTTDTTRRREIRRSRAEHETPLSRRAWQRLVEDFGVVPIAVAVVFGLGAALILAAGRHVTGWRLGMDLPFGVSARVPFQIEDVETTALRRVQARDSSPNIFVADAGLLEELRGRFANLLSLARIGADPSRLVAEMRAAGVAIDDDAARELRRLADAGAEAAYQATIEGALRTLAAQNLVEVSDLAVRRTPLRAILVQDSSERSVPSASLQFAGEADSVTRAADAVAAAFDPPLRSVARQLVTAVLRPGDGAAAPRALYRFDPARTDALARQAERAVRTEFLRFEAKARLADPGPIGENELARLRAEEHAYERALASDPALRARERWSWVGRSALAFFVAAGVATYVSRVRVAARRRPARLAGVAALLLLMLAIARGAFLRLDATPPHFAAGCQALAAAILTIVYPQRFALGASGALALLLTLATNQGAAFLAVMLAVSAGFILGLRDVRRRGKIVAVGLASGLLGAAASLAADMAQGQTRAFMTWQALWCAGSTIAAGFIVEGTLPFIERVFGLATNMTLLEWCDANKPLLRLMASRAPGTYNHSLILGAMAEAAAEAVQANGLLARAGAYYHDIGKINKPDYFAENQQPGESRHEGLAPTMSLLVIINHVKDGIEMAREWNLPQVLHPFIAEHHGTTLVEYFYHAASRERGPDEPEIDDTQYRYPGPKPQSRETAIVMLCDGVEGAVRAMPEPTPSRIEGVVSQVVRKRLLDGQLDECDLDFRELGAVQQSLVKSLCGIYHGRIAYPAEQEPAPARAL